MEEFYDTDKQKKVEEKQERDEQRFDNDMKKILSMPEGRRMFHRFFRDCGIHTSSFTGNSTTFFKEGERNIGLIWLRHIMKAKPEAYTQMIQENYSEIKSFQKLQEEKK